MSECWGWLQLDWKFFQVVKTWAPLAVCLPSAVVMTHCFAATTQWPAVSTVLELTRVPVHDPMGLPDPSRSSMNTLAGFPDDPTVTCLASDVLPHATKPPMATTAPSTPT